MRSFNRVWTSPNTLPTKREIADPPSWMSRVLRAEISRGTPEPPEINGGTQEPPAGTE